MSNPVPSPIRDATSTRRGLMGITAQTFSGVKTFLDAIKLALKTTATLPTGGPELEGSMVYDSTTKRAQVHDGTSWVPVVMATSGTGSITLEEHIASSNAHPAGSIEYDGGDTAWADGTVYSPDTARTALSTIVDTLSAPGGAAKVGTTPGGGMAGTNAQAQLNELDSKISDKSGFLAFASGGHDVAANFSGNKHANITRISAGVYDVTFSGVTLPPDVLVPVYISVLSASTPVIIVSDWTTPGSVLRVRTFNLSGTAWDSFISVAVPEL